MVSWPDGDVPILGFWGYPTSTENFCEEDYKISSFIGEFINTLTSIGYILYAWHGIRMIRTRKLPEASWMPYLALAGVGTLSAMFHATLKVETQRCDSLSMLVAASAPLHRVMTFQQSKAWTRWFSYGLISVLVVITVLYVTRDILILHQVAFAAICAAVAYKTRELMKARVKDPATRRRLKTLAIVGIVSGLAGFATWLIDQFYCPSLRSLRHSIGLPWAFVLEFHGWWHILTGVCSYTYLTLVEVILTDPQVKQGDKHHDLFAWPVSALLRPGKKPEKKPHSNGTARKSNGSARKSGARKSRSPPKM